MKLFANMQTVKSGPVLVVNRGPVAVSLPTQDLSTLEDEKAERLRHRALAHRLGVMTVAAQMPRLRQTLLDLHVNRYQLADVESWMDKQAEEANRSWGWYPLRHVDVCFLDFVRRATPQPKYSSTFGMSRETRYRDIVPTAVLSTVQAIVSCIGDEAAFFVGALDVLPDPFLAVISRHDDKRTMYVIERWDEPGFRSSKPSS